MCSSFKKKLNPHMLFFHDLFNIYYLLISLNQTSCFLMLLISNCNKYNNDNIIILTKYIIFILIFKVKYYVI